MFADKRSLISIPFDHFRYIVDAAARRVRVCLEGVLLLVFGD